MPILATSRFHHFHLITLLPWSFVGIVFQSAYDMIFR